jgi:hypothetical protein
VAEANGLIHSTMTLKDTLLTRAWKWTVFLWFLVASSLAQELFGEGAYMFHDGLVNSYEDDYDR